MTFICRECEQIFERPKKYTEVHGLEYSPYEEYYGCPHCGGSFVETIRCDECHVWIDGEYVELQHSKAYVCDRCFTLHNIFEDN